VQGGELFGRLQNSPTPGRIRPEEARFYAACVVDSFEYLHSLHIVYRDLKVRAGAGWSMGARLCWATALPQWGLAASITSSRAVGLFVTGKTRLCVAALLATSCHLVLCPPHPSAPATA